MLWKLIHSWFLHENLVSNEYRGQIDCKKISNTKLIFQVLVLHHSQWQGDSAQDIRLKSSLTKG